MHESGFDASLTFNTRVRRVKAAVAYLPLSIKEVDEICTPLCGERGLVVLRDFALPRQSYRHSPSLTAWRLVMVLNSEGRLDLMVRGVPVSGSEK